MEPANIEWERLVSKYEVDPIYENIDAPQWVDLLSFSSSPDDDVAWFCRPDCKHPRTAEDFLNSTPSSSSKLFRSVSVSKLMGLVDWNLRDMKLKRRGTAPSSRRTSCGEEEEDSENQNPNKAVFKSSAQKGRAEVVEEEEEEESRPRLKTTRSAKDLFEGGRDLFGKISEFCNELKTKMVATGGERGDLQGTAAQKDGPCLILGGPRLDNPPRSKERKPFHELPVVASTKDSNLHKKILRANDSENIPVSLNLNTPITKSKPEENLLAIRTNPPTPQGFSATPPRQRHHPSKTTPPRSKGPKSRLAERGILQEQRPGKTLREELVEHSPDGKNAASSPPLETGREGRNQLDVFWLFKPCALSS